MSTAGQLQTDAQPGRTPQPEIVAALRQVAQLQDLTDAEYEWLASHGIERFTGAGDTLFHEGEPARKMTIMLRGEIQVRREHGGASAIFIGRSGQITGLIPFSRMKAYGGLGFTTMDTWSLEFDKSLFPEMLQAIPSLTAKFVSVLLDRVREVTRMEQQSEKLNALGKLAGNLAHELNNPASAAQRSAAGMLEELRVYGHEKFKLGSLCLDEGKIACVRAWDASVRQAAAKPAADSHLSITEREDLLVKWLVEHGVEQTWHIAPELAELGLQPEQLDPLTEFLDPEALAVVLSQFASSLRAERIAEAMLDSTARIFDLIRAIKDYSYMDQAPIQEVDVPQSLENTLSMLQSRLKKVEITRDYEPDLPRINVYGSEMNQVWMALIENALDAIQDHGHIRLSCRVSGDMMLIEVWDNGPGIAPELTDRIFEPFFTTKAPGHGLGLGLDTVTRIVRIHRGFVTTQSKPGSTCFQVRLPLAQMLAY